MIDLSGPGGAQTVMLDLARNLDRSTWQSIAAVADTGWLSEELGRAGVEYVVVPIRGTPFDWRYLLRLVRLIRSRGIHLIHAHLLGPSVYAGLAGLLTGVPTVSTFHGQVDIAPDERFVRAKFAIVNRASRVVFVSRALCGHFLDHTPLRRDLACVIHNGIEFRDHSENVRGGLRRELGVGGDQILIGAIGHIREPKGYDTLLHAMFSLVQRSPDYRLVIVGGPDDTDLEGKLLDLRDQLGLSGIAHFAGFRAEVGPVLADLDIYVISSTQEGLSISTIQALDAGLPVVATRCGGPEEIVDDERTGLLVEARDAGGMADAIERLARDRELAVRLGTSGRASVRERFDVRSMVHAYDLTYRQALDQPRPR